MRCKDNPLFFGPMCHVLACFWAVMNGSSLPREGVLFGGEGASDGRQRGQYVVCFMDSDFPKQKQKKQALEWLFTLWKRFLMSIWQHIKFHCHFRFIYTSCRKLLNKYTLEMSRRTTVANIMC